VLASRFIGVRFTLSRREDRKGFIFIDSVRKLRINKGSSPAGSVLISCFLFLISCISFFVFVFKAINIFLRVLGVFVYPVKLFMLLFH
jgi:hypothetical protein